MSRINNRIIRKCEQSFSYRTYDCILTAVREIRTSDRTLE